MTEEHSARPAEELARKAARARSQSRMLRAETVKVTGQVADTEETVAETLARLATQHPHHGSQLRAKSKAAAKHAARQRQWRNRPARPPATGGSGAA